MTKQSIVSTAKFAALSLSAVAFSLGSFAADSPAKGAQAAKTFNVKYVGAAEDGFMFSLKYENPTAGNYEVLVKDETGETLYQQAFTDKNFSKKFELSKSMIKAVFIVRPQYGAEQSFEVSVESRTSEDVVVNRL